MTHRPTLSVRDLARLWGPLALTWLLMAAEGPVLAAVVARLPSPAVNLAAYGVALSIAMILEAPILMLLSASTKLVQDGQSYLALRRFSLLLNAGVTMLMFLLLATGAMQTFTAGWIGLPADVSERTVSALWLLLPWPGAIGLRRFYQGLLISSGRTHLIAWGTVLRLGVIATCALLLPLVTDWPGALTCALALSLAVTLEALATRRMCRETLARVLATERTAPPLTLPAIATFYHPLATTTIIALAIHPAVSFFLGQGRLVVVSLAVFPVVAGFIFLFRGTFGLSFQEIGLSMMEKHPRSLATVVRFAAILAVVATCLVSAAAFTPVGAWWFGTVSGLSPALVKLAAPPLMILAGLPALSLLLSFQRAAIISGAPTGSITVAGVLEVVVTLCVLLITIHTLDLVGATAAAASLMTGRLVANAFLILPTRRALRTISLRT